MLRHIIKPSNLQRISHRSRRFMGMNVATLRSPNPSQHLSRKPQFATEHRRTFATLIGDKEKENQDLEEDLKKETALQELMKEKGMYDFIRKTYLYTGGAVAGSITLAQIISPMAVHNPWLFMLGGFGTAIGCGIGLGMQKGTVISTKYGHEMKNSNGRVLTYIGAVGGFSAMVAPFIGTINQIDPSILPMASLTTLGVFGAASAAAYALPKYSLTPYYGPLIGGVFGLVGISLAGLGANWLGYPEFAAMAHNINTYAGLGIFTCLVAADTHVAMREYKNGNPDHLETSYMFYGDFMNILIRIMDIMARNNK